MVFTKRIIHCCSNLILRGKGYSRRYLKETIQFNSIALASLSENYTQILALLASGDIDQEWFDEYDEKHYSLENKLIRYNSALIKKLKAKEEWQSDYRISSIVASYDSAEQ